MKALNRAIEKFLYRHPRFGIRGLIRIVVIAQAILLIISYADKTGTLFYYLYFSPTLISSGEVWRIVSWMFIPPVQSNLIYAAIELYFMFFLGTQLERTWGTAKFSFYWFFGAALSLVASTIAALAFKIGIVQLTTEWLNLSLFFAFAVLFPETRFLLFFFIPVKVKWLALLSAAFFLYQIISALVKLNFLQAIILIIPLLNFLLIVGLPSLNMKRVKARVRHAAPIHVGRTEMQHAAYNHKCVVCGKTDITDPGLEFRYCSRCSGFQCYCLDHINNHEHV